MLWGCLGVLVLCSLDVMCVLPLPLSLSTCTRTHTHTHTHTHTQALTGTSSTTPSTSSIGAFILSPLLTSQQTTATNSQGGVLGGGTSTASQLGVPSTVMSLFGASPISSGSLTSSDDLPSMPSVPGPAGGAPNLTHNLN